MDTPTSVILLRVIVAMAVGAFVGIERERKNKPAGVRTYMLVAGASALFLLINDEVARQFTALGGNNAQADPTRIVQAIMIGISFIGAGTILKSGGKNDVMYLTTAASILFTAALGIVVGLGLYVLALTLAVTVVLILFVIGLIEDRLKK